MQWPQTNIKGKTRSFKLLLRKQKSSNTNPTKIRGEIRSSGGVNGFCPTRATCRVTLVTNPVCDYDKQNMFVVICDTGIP